jgi:hypothetical protein
MIVYYKSSFTAILILRSQQRRLQAKTHTDVHPLPNVACIIGPERTTNVTFFPVHAKSIDSTNKMNKIKIPLENTCSVQENLEMRFVLPTGSRGGS